MRGGMGTAHASGRSGEPVSRPDRREGPDSVPCPHVRLRDVVVFDAILRGIRGAVDTRDRGIPACSDRAIASAPALSVTGAALIAIRRPRRSALPDYAGPRAFTGLVDDPAARTLYRHRHSRC